MKHIQPKKNERGSAILMTLGVLSIVMVIAMLFVATARNTRTIADAGADDVRAAVLAESAEAFAFSILQEMTQTDGDYRPANSSLTDGSGVPLVQYKPDSGEDDDWHQPYIGSFAFGGGIVGQAELEQGDLTQNAVFTKPDVGVETGYAATELAESANWLWTPVRGSHLGTLAQSSAFNNIYNNAAGFQNVTDADGEIIGRYGFVILPEGSKFNLNGIVNPLVSGAASHAIPALKYKDPQIVKLDGSVDISDVYMPLGLGNAISGHNPDDETKTGAFPIMGFDSFDVLSRYDYDEQITETETLLYGLHPQEIRAPSNDYATPPGNAPKWHNYLQLNQKIPTFKDNYALLFGLTGGTDEPEMVYDGHATITAGALTTPPPELGKMNIQLADLKCGTDTYKCDQLGWDSIYDHFRNGACITHGNCEWSKKLFRYASILGGKNNTLEFQDENGTNINAHIMANLVDFCDEDDVVTYLIDENAGIDYSNLETTITATNIGTLKDENKLVCGNELAPAVIGVKLDVALEGGTFENKIENRGTSLEPDWYNVWKMTQQHTIKIKPTISLANIYEQLPTDGEYKIKIAIAGKIVENYLATPDGHPALVAHPDNNSTYSDVTSTFFIAPQEFTVGVIDSTPDSPIAGPDATFLSKDIILDEMAVLVEKPKDFTDDVGDFKSMYGRLDSLDSITCTITDVLVVLQPADVASKVTTGFAATDYPKVISDIAYFHKETESTEEDSFATFAAPTIDGAPTVIKVFNAKDPSNKPWTGYALAKDPRCNDRWDAWNLDAIAIKDQGVQADTITLGDKAWNSIVAECGTTAADKDYEPDLVAGAAPGTVFGDTFSTAYIANEPFTSLWQLGAVHRYEPGRTINLHKYNDNLTVGKYTDGDAALLDFLKVTEATNGILGKFNPNCFNEGAYTYLLKQVPFDDGTNGAKIYRAVKGSENLETAGEDVGTFVDFTSFSAKDAYKNQSWLPMQAFMRFCTPKANVGSDREIEAFYGCTAGLLSTRYEAFTVITVGQSLSLLDGIVPATPLADVKKMGVANPVLIHDRWYSTLGTRVELVTVLRDCWLNKFQIVNRQRL